MTFLLLSTFILWIHIAFSFSQHKLTHNIAFDGPFNHYVGESPRRRQLDGTYPLSADNVQFYHGVASGDPTSNDLVIWTRVTPPYQNKWSQYIYNGTELDQMITKYQYVTVQWAISTSTDALNLSQYECNEHNYINCGITETSLDIDYTVKIIVDELESDTWYYYQFAVGNVTSNIGHTRTVPESKDDVNAWRFAFSSCKQYAHGYFTNLGDVANRNDLDMMVFLGDYIYEFPNGPLVNGTSINHEPYPNNFLYNLSHYRGRYLQHHLDENVQLLHQALPWYIVWDDHEVVNDHWKDGAPAKWQDDDLYGVNFETRKQNAYQAFFEWLPVRPIDINANGGLYKSQNFGNLFDLMMIDTRSQRTQDVESVEAAVNLTVDEHYVFGTKQRDWFINQLKLSQNNNVKWRIIGSDGPFGQSPPPTVFPKVFFGADDLEGYHQERKIILDAIIDNDIANVVSISGGPHTGIAQKVYSTGKPIKNDDASYPIFTEFVNDAFSAPKLFEKDNWLPYMDDYKTYWDWVSPYFRLLADGYCIMDINKDRIKVEYWINYNLTTNNDIHSELDRTFCVNDGIVEFYDCMTTQMPDTTISASDQILLTFEESETDVSHDADTDSDNDGWMIIGIVFIVLFGISCIVATILFADKIRNKRQNQGYNKPEPDTEITTINM